MGSGATKPRAYQCNLNVYNLLKEGSLGSLFGELTGMRALHTGIAVIPMKKQSNGEFVPASIGVEYAYGSNGVWKQIPQATPPFENTTSTFRKSINMGIFVKSKSEINNIIKELKRSWLGKDYDGLTKNCNNFSNELCQKLVNKTIPNDINMLAETTVGVASFIGGMLNEFANAMEQEEINNNNMNNNNFNNNNKNNGPEIVQLN